MTADALRSFALLAALAWLPGCDGPQQTPTPPNHGVIPVPDSVEIVAGDSLIISASVPIVVDAGDAEGARIGGMLASWIGNSVETTPAVLESAGDAAVAIRLTIQGASSELGIEGYDLEVSESGVTITAPTHAGLFYGVQTLRQLLPWYVEYEGIQERPLPVPFVRIVDTPRYAWRGTMLDVARHFFEPSHVERMIDLAAKYKINRLHMHLSDDQGWRIEIPGWPNLTAHGGQTQVGGGTGGYYTTQQFADLVEYAADRFIQIIPEIDMPGHTNAALASYPELNCDGEAPDLYTGIAVGFSTLCVDKEVTYEFVDAVVGELARLTPAPYFHIGGDEVEELTEAEYAQFMDRVYEIVASHGKTVIGWDEIAGTPLAEGDVVQLWRPFWDVLDQENPDSARLAFAEAQAARVGRALDSGARLILSPADRIYLDMKYDEETVLGLEWAGGNDERDAYGLGTATWLRGLPEEVILGVEAPLWTETTATIHDLEYLAFPRLAGVAEFGWSREEDRRWASYLPRLQRHAKRWTAMGVNYRRSAATDP